MTYLVDVNVLSEPTRITPNPKLIEWLKVHEKEIVIDPVILASFVSGYCRFKQGASGQGSRLGSKRWQRPLTVSPGIPPLACAGHAWSSSSGKKGAHCPCWTA